MFKPTKEQLAEWARRRQQRVAAQLAELRRLEAHPGQQHAMAMLHARAGRVVAARRGRSVVTGRAWWVLFARSALAKAKMLR